jgi:hypothetical protein
MNSIKINTIPDQQPGNYNGVGKQSGKPYTLYQKAAITDELGFVTLKSMSKALPDLAHAGKTLIVGQDGIESIESKQTQYGMSVDVVFAKAGGAYGGKNNYTPKKYITKEKYAEVITWCAERAKEVFPDKAVEAFDKILGVYSVVVDIAPEQNVQGSLLTRDTFDTAVTNILAKPTEIRRQGFDILWSKVRTEKPKISAELFNELHIAFVTVAGFDPEPKAPAPAGNQFDDSAIPF